MTFSSVFLGVATALMVKVFPLFTVFVFGTPVSFVVLTFGITLIVTTDFLLPAFTVILAVPTCFPVTTPLEFTVAIFLLEEPLSKKIKDVMNVAVISTLARGRNWGNSGRS